MNIHGRGMHLASTSGDCTVKLWSFEKARCIHTFADHTQVLMYNAFSPKKKILRLYFIKLTLFLLLYYIIKIHHNFCRILLLKYAIVTLLFIVILMVCYFLHFPAPLVDFQ